MIDNRVCPTCGKKIKYLENENARSNNKYCSRECYELTRSPILQEAKRQGKTIRQLIVDLMNEYKKPTIAGEIIGTSHLQIMYWIKKLKIKAVWQ